jgi:hypothetical protein
MLNESASEHVADGIAPEPERLGPSVNRDASAHAGNARAPDTTADASDWIDSFRDIHFTWNERGPAGESERSPGDNWWRSLGELDTEIDAEPTGDTAAGSLETRVWWRAPDEQLAFARSSSILPAESDGLTRARKPAGDAGGAGRAQAERGRRGAWVLAGFAALAILVAGTLGIVVVSRSDGSRPAGKIVSDRTTAPTTTTQALPTTIPPVPETSVPAPSVPAAPPPTAARTPATTARTPTTSGRTVPPQDEGAVEPPPAPPAPPPPDPLPPPPPTTTPPPPST